MKKKLRRLPVLALGCALLFFTLAAQGTQNDPLVTLGYLTEQFLPQVAGEVEARAAERDKSLEEKLQAMVDAYAGEMEQRFGKLAGGGESGTSAGFSVVGLTAGQRLTLSTGGEVLLRSGAALCEAPSTPGLVDATAGTVLAGGGALEANHLYLAAGEGRGLTASEAVTVLVRGDYIIE